VGDGYGSRLSALELDVVEVVDDVEVVVVLR
jgi:hypothetical protein